MRRRGVDVLHELAKIEELRPRKQQGGEGSDGPTLRISSPPLVTPAMVRDVLERLSKPSWRDTDGARYRCARKGGAK